MTYKKRELDPLFNYEDLVTIAPIDPPADFLFPDIHIASLYVWFNYENGTIWNEHYNRDKKCLVWAQFHLTLDEQLSIYPVYVSIREIIGVR